MARRWRSRWCRAARGYQPRGLCRRRSRRVATATPRAEGAGGARVSPVTMRNDDLGRRVGRHGTAICNMNADGAVEIGRSRWCRAARGYQPRGLCRRRSRRVATATPRAEGAGGARVSPVTMRNDDLGRRVGRHGTAICNMNADGAVEIVRSRWCRAARGYQPWGLCRRRARRAATATPRAEGAGGTRVSPVTIRNDDIAHRIVA